MYWPTSVDPEPCPSLPGVPGGPGGPGGPRLYESPGQHINSRIKFATLFAFLSLSFFKDILFLGSTVTNLSQLRRLL